jgi:hypothetical protein
MAGVHAQERERGGGRPGWLQPWAEIGGARPNTKRNLFFITQMKQHKVPNLNQKKTFLENDPKTKVNLDF